MKSKIKIKSIVVLACLSIVTLFFINISFAANTAKVNVETANLRESADSNSKILILLPLNQEVELIEKEGNWYKVKVQGITGYLREDIITLTTPEGSTSTESNNTVTNTESEVNATTVNTTDEGNTMTTANTTSEENTEASKVESTQNNTNKKKVKEDVKLKIIPAINATDIIEVKHGEEVTIIEKLNGWVCIETGLTKGWVREDKLTEIEVVEEQPAEETEETEATKNPEEEEKEPISAEVSVAETILKTLYVNTELVNVRKEASTTSDVVVRLSLNTAVDVYSELGDWYKVKVSGEWGYISSSLLSDTKKEITTTSRGAETTRQSNTGTASETETSSTNIDTASTTTTAPSTIGATVVETAKSYIGCKYVYGGASPSGFDCSGFTSYVFKLHGITLNRTAAGQYSNGTAVARSDLQAGDLVMFGPSVSGINHVGIYIGGGQIVHAANSSRGVTTDTINSGYYNNNYVGARRVN